MTKTYFADTHALIGMIDGTPGYRKYVDCAFVTAEYNLVELLFHLLKKFDETTALWYFRFYLDCKIELTASAIISGTKFKLRYEHERMSYVDCVGYALAQEQGIPFLTGDSKFENKANVAFVK